VRSESETFRLLVDDRDEERRDRAGLGIRLEGLEDVESVAVGEKDVEKDEIGPGGARQRETLIRCCELS